ncbi:alpha/beta hydrolase [Pseudoalteromonas tunicata]|uniref:Putative phospholipase/carboxylesterase family protein n=1 Tax=Pseudoalteromonas tunicata D2 TaxID=87626 RepID=A4CFD7_9GAMM|nr:dienelactone hydrolase family protein [Pseudoalteromonas tunicata]ATC92929.1 phospholipase/carboxylesterase [Pseudoalteromonas tunicata]AXT32028.1 carboxylesterase [Pseudoalteromonas tunicata]EAR26575.1 putative phospholipase/carboxylesterase family protein [Pseudoalteromonas tunicata D2]
MSLDGVVCQAMAEHKATVIWLHGLGDSGDGFAPIVPALKLPAELGIKFIFPHAPIQPVTINGGMKMRSWYDIVSFDLDKRADEQGVRESAAKVEQLIENEIASGIPANKIILAGFSQGGVIALHLAPRFKAALAGVMALSTYMCAPDKFSAEAIQTSLSVLMVHGSLDEVVPMQAGKQAYDVLQSNGLNVHWSDYPMAHEVCGEEVALIRQWLIERLS